MSIELINGEVGFAGQLSAQDIRDLAGQGVKTFVCNRPDGEGSDQPDRAELEAAATQSGATFHYLPLQAGVPPEETLIRAYAEVYKAAEKPLIAFCRTGRRSNMIHSGAAPLLE